VLEREGSGAVAQLAAQQPDDSIVFQARSQARGAAHTLLWRNKPSVMDACIATHALNAEAGGLAGVMAIAVSRTRIVGGSGTSVFVYDREEGELLHEIEGGCDVKSVAIAETEDGDGGGWIAAGYVSGLISVWHLGTFVLKVERPNAHGGWVMSLALTYDGKLLVSGSDDQSIKAWDAGTLELVAERQGAHSDHVRSITISPEGTAIASGSDDQSIKVWSIGTLELKAEQPAAHSKAVTCVAFLPGDSGRGGQCMLVSGSADRSIKTWVLPPVAPGTLTLKAEKQNAHDVNVNCVAVSPDGKRVASGANDRRLKVWDAATLQLTGEKQSAHRGWMRYAHNRRVNCVSFSPDGTMIVSGSHDGSVRVWHAGATAERPNGDCNLVACVDFSPDGTRIVSCSADRCIRVYDASTLALTAERQAAHDSWIRSVGFSKDGETVVSCSADKSICVWDASSLELKARKENAHSSVIASVHFSPDSACKTKTANIVSGSWDQSICIWDADSLEPKARRENAHSSCVMSIASSPDGNALASGSSDKSIKLWHHATLELIAERRDSHNHWVMCVAFSPDCRSIVSGSFTRSICVWDAGTLALLAVKQAAHGDVIRSIAFSNDGTMVVSGSDDGTIKVWEKSKKGEEGWGGGLQEGGTFFAQSPVRCVAVQWPRMVGGGMAGELFQLEDEMDLDCRC
jgi:WD40 repeat protein